jgi:hypothetical protein
MYIRFMFQLTTQSKRIQILLEFLRSQLNGRATFVEMLDHLNEVLPSIEQKKISRRTLEADLQFMREELDLSLKHVNISRRHYYQLIEKAELQQELKQDLEGLMLHQLAKNFGLEHYLDSSPGMSHLESVLSFSFSALDDGGKAMKLAMDIVQSIFAQEAIQFWYKPIHTTYRSKLQIVAPLQVKFYDGRFYLVAADYKDNSEDQFKRSIKIFAFDMIEDYVIAPAQMEMDDADASIRTISFHHADLAHKVGLKDYFKHCLGVARFKDSEPEYIRIKFTDWAMSYVRERLLHRSQRIVVDHPNYMVVELYIYRTYELDMLLARFREFGVEVK